MPTPYPALTRRELFRIGALTVSGFELLPLIGPRNVWASSSVTPRGQADSVIFINLRGGPAQMDTFDAKPDKQRPEDFDMRTTPQGYLWPYGLMPKLAERLDDLCILRSMEAWDTVHSRAQFYLQTGHHPSPARNEEMPSIGSVVSYESLASRRDSDYLPTFVGMNYDAKTMYGPMVKEGRLPVEHAPLTLDLERGELPFVLDERDRPNFDRRWELLQKLDHKRRRLDAPASQRAHAEFAAYGEGVRRMMSNAGLRKLLEISDADHQRYGATAFGDSCILARNAVSADAGARFIMLTHKDWDHHGNIYKPGAGLYALCPELDNAFAPLLEDLKAIRKPDGSTQLDHTLVVAVGEFGRTPGELTLTGGREHYAGAMNALFAGAGVLGGRAIGGTDDLAAKVTDPGWSPNRPIYVEDVAATIYSALGIDWTKRLTGMPSGRDYVYVDPAAGSGYYQFQEIGELYS
jgi:hypothetical protein